jgi:hypothetical protein
LYPLRLIPEFTRCHTLQQHRTPFDLLRSKATVVGSFSIGLLEENLNASAPGFVGFLVRRESARMLSRDREVYVQQPCRGIGRAAIE